MKKEKGKLEKNIAKPEYNIQSRLLLCNQKTKTETGWEEDLWE